jgi:hypothetical protein
MIFASISNRAHSHAVRMVSRGGEKVIEFCARGYYFNLAAIDSIKTASFFIKFELLNIAMNILPNFRHHIGKGILIIVLLIICLSTLPAQNVISNYKVFFAVGDYANKKMLVIRKFERSGQQFYVAVGFGDLETCIIPANKIHADSIDWQHIFLDYDSTAYIKALQTASKQSFSLQNSGISHGFPKEKGITLTIDLCPSEKPLDRDIFTSLISEFKKIETPAPIAISITGRFMLNHSEDFAWLKSLIARGEISVTWINHTFNHYYNPKIPLEQNFLLEPGTDLNSEILKLEIALLRQDLLFSVFFRFPGLVSDHQLVEDVISYGLIPIGSDAWLAKGQPANAGSIVLIHGNGNEPLGVKDFITLLQNEQASVMEKQWLLYDLRESVEEEIQN